jgi:hypothetical protein
MKAPAVDHLVLRQLFPNPKSGDPISFARFACTYLVPEVRLETASFYGNLDSLEAMYPGLDYTSAPHRTRLGRFTWHRRLFHVFDRLGLTDAEIHRITKWEGTLWARQRYEKDRNVTIKDTTGIEITVWVPEESRPRNPSVAEESSTDTEDELETEPRNASNIPQLRPATVHTQTAERLPRPAAATSSALQLDISSFRTQEEWEAYFKEAVESWESSYLQVMTIPELLRQSRGAFRQSSANIPAEDESSSSSISGHPEISLELAPGGGPSDSELGMSSNQRDLQRALSRIFERCPQLRSLLVDARPISQSNLTPSQANAIQKIWECWQQVEEFEAEDLQGWLSDLRDLIGEQILDTSPDAGRTIEQTTVSRENSEATSEPSTTSPERLEELSDWIQRRARTLPWLVPLDDVSHADVGTEIGGQAYMTFLQDHFNRRYRRRQIRDVRRQRI